MRYSPEHLPDLADRHGQSAYIQRVSASLAAIFKIGLGDHIHCSVFRKYPQNPPSVAQMEESLGPVYKGLLPVVKAAVPPRYRMVLAHQCSYDRRKFVHFTFKDGNDMVSLVIARKEAGETLAGLSVAGQASGIPVYRSAADRYEVAAFEADEYLAFVVSELKKGENLQVAVGLAPGVRHFLQKA
jgi:hypothetical protein